MCVIVVHSSPHEDDLVLQYWDKTFRPMCISPIVPYSIYSGELGHDIFWSEIGILVTIHQRLRAGGGEEGGGSNCK